MQDDQRTRQSRRTRAVSADGSSTLTLLQGGASEPPPPAPPAVNGGAGRPRVKKLRLAIILFGLSLLAIISTVFGMMMAVAQDLPSLETTNEFKASRNSILLDHSGHQRIAVLTGNENRILVKSEDVSPSVKHAVIAIEDQRFFSHKGIDYRGIARALWADIRRKRAAEGGSTITQQFVKNALIAQTNRSLFQKLKEAALAYQLERKWTKDKILTQYLNTVYFGEGAYGIESAARVYFGWDHPDCEPHCAAVLRPDEAAMLAGLIASPSAYSPIQNPVNAQRRRNLVLDRMRELDLLTPSEYSDMRTRALPPRNEIRPPRKISEAPYFTAWVEQQLVDRYGTGATFGGGLEVRTSLDFDLQKAAEQAIAGRLAGVGPSAALVALDNKTGAVRALVGGGDFDNQPFNLATQGHRQPGSAFKPFTLVAALEKGIAATQTFVSAPKTLGSPRRPFKVHNYEDQYAGSASLATATTISDNSIYAEVGYKLVGTRRIARVAKDMGIRTPLSTNPAMILGGLREGVTPLEMADSYLTLAHGGSRVSGSLAAFKDGPVAYTSVDGHGIHDRNETDTDRVVPQSVADQVRQILATVITSGTGKAAQIGEFAAGKTGTTENYQDAWFVGFTDTLTVAVWVGYPKGAQAMETEYRGEPVAGGTYPAEIWRDFLLSVKKIRAARGQGDTQKDGDVTPVLTPGPSSTTPGPAEPSAEERKGRSKKRSSAKETPAPAPDQAPKPDEQPSTTPPTPQPPDSGGSGGAEIGAGGTP
jgi:penicillin-binding protein 1A